MNLLIQNFYSFKPNMMDLIGMMYNHHPKSIQKFALIPMHACMQHFICACITANNHYIYTTQDLMHIFLKACVMHDRCTRCLVQSGIAASNPDTVINNNNTSLSCIYVCLLLYACMQTTTVLQCKTFTFYQSVGKFRHSLIFCTASKYSKIL